MRSSRNIVAIDLGNSSGRVVLGQWNGGRGILRQIYRFPNEPKEEAGHVMWDIERIWQEILKGLRIAARAYPGARRDLSWPANLSVRKLASCIAAHAGNVARVDLKRE